MAKREEVRLTPEQWTKEPAHGRFYVRVVLSAVLTIAALYVILSQKFPPEPVKWATNLIFFIIGNWLPAR